MDFDNVKNPYNIAEFKVNKIEEALQNKTNINEVFAYISRFWLAYAITKDKKYLHKANHKAITSFTANSGSVEFCLMAVFMSIEANNIEIAENMINSLSSYKNYYKNNRPDILVFIYFFSGIISIKNNRLLYGSKMEKNINKILDEKSAGFNYLLLGYLNFKMENSNKAFSLYEKAYDMGCRSCFLYWAILEYLKERNVVLHKTHLLFNFFSWCISQGIDITDIIDFHSEHIYFENTNYTKLYERIYNVYNSKWFLDKLCKSLIFKNDYSKKAFYYYKLAETKQLQIPDLSVHIIKAAYKNDFEDISNHSLKQFLNTDYLEISNKPFIYHLILTNEKFEDLANLMIDHILEFSFYCYENGITGRHVNSIYKHILENSEKFKIPYNNIKMLEDAISKDLFTFTINSESPFIKYIWIKEKDIKEWICYTVENGTAQIKAINEHFTYICFSEGMKCIIDEKNCVIKKAVERGEPELYMRFYKNGHTSDQLIMALSKYFMSLDKIDAKTMNDAVEILSKAVLIKNISKSFKMQALAVLGNILFMLNLKEKAIQYYKGIDENYLDDKFIEQMINVFIEMGQMDNSVRLISKKAHCIPDKTLFKAIKTISSNENYHKNIVDVAYKLLLKSWYDKILLDIVLKYYKGSQKGWQELNKALLVISVHEKKLDEIILKNAMWLHNIDKGSQKVFVRMYENYPKDVLVGLFIYYTVYEIIINNIKPEYEVIGILEKMFKKNNDELLAYSLSTVYLNHNIVTILSEEILEKAIEIMEQNKILFPVFKSFKDKFSSLAYIVKNMPFIYRCRPNKNVYLNYKFDQEQEFRQQKMDYFRFGLYVGCIIHFSGEKATYYFSEELPKGSIVTKEQTIENNSLVVYENSEDMYFIINNAVVYEQMFKYDKVDDIVTDALKDFCSVRGKLM